MVEHLSPLNNSIHSTAHERHDALGVTLSSRPMAGLWQLSGWDDFETAVSPSLEKLGLRELGNFQEAQQVKDGKAWRIAPDRLLVETSLDLSEFNCSDLAVLDLSHARTVVKINGVLARTVLSQVTSVNVAEDQFQPGSFIQTGIHHVGVLIQCISQNDFEILVPSSWAESVWDFIFDNAMPYGVCISDAD